MKQIGRVLGSNLDLDPLLGEIVSRTTDLLEADRSTLFLVDDEKDELELVHGSGPKIKMTGDEIVLSCGSCEIKITTDNISLNSGQIKIGLAGVSLVNGAMTFGTPP